MHARRGNQRGQAFEENQGLEYHVRGAVAPGSAELVQHTPARREAQALRSEGGTGDVAAQVFEAIAVVGRDVDGGVQRESLDVRTQGRGIEARAACGEPGQAAQPGSRLGALGHPALNRGGLEERELAAFLVFLSR